MQGAEGIAVGMSTRILPHNFVELLEAEIAIFEEREFLLLPDFPTGGTMDAAGYDKGRGKVKLRAKIEVKDDKTIVIEEICYGTTTESVIQSIDEAAKKGKIKIDSIHDFTSDKVEIEIKLPRGQHASQLIDALYGFTDCEVTLNTQMVVIKDGLPIEATVDEILRYNAECLKGYLQKELEIEKNHLKEKIFQKTLEQIFIGHRLYKRIEEVASQEKIHETIAASLVPFHDQLIRIPTKDDHEKLLSIPIRRISRFDIDRSKEEIIEIEKQLLQIERNLQQMVKFSIQYLKNLIKKYGKSFPRKTEIQSIEGIDKRALETRKTKVYINLSDGFVGTKVSSETFIECTNYDKLLLFYKDGTYSVVNISEKQFVNQNEKILFYVGIADKKSPISIVYRDLNTQFAHAKRFIIEKFIIDKVYPFLEDNQKLECFTVEPEGTIHVQFEPKPKQKQDSLTIALKDVPLKGVSSKGIRLANKEIKKCKIENSTQKV
jgi:topoisomerase-4 subunit A